MTKQSARSKRIASLLSVARKDILNCFCEESRRRLTTKQSAQNKLVLWIISVVRNNTYSAKMNKQYYVYFMTNKNNTVIYTGVTSDLKKRVYEHKAKLVKGFTKRYNLDKLVQYEVFDDPYNAISREKQIKGGSRQRKIDLINNMNKEWKDLYEGL